MNDEMRCDVMGVEGWDLHIMALGYMDSIGMGEGVFAVFRVHGYGV